MTPELFCALILAGMEEKELSAEVRKIPGLIKRAVPRECVLSFTRGHTPITGFGLGGATGGGKTYAVAALVKCLAEILVPESDQNQGALNLKWLYWISWPHMADKLRKHAVDGTVDHLVERACQVSLLILDDLGRERIRGSYHDDFATSQLDLIIDDRHRKGFTTLYTTNLSHLDFATRYGGPITSRLFGMSPLIFIDGLKDLRLE